MGMWNGVRDARTAAHMLRVLQVAVGGMEWNVDMVRDLDVHTWNAV